MNLTELVGVKSEQLEALVHDRYFEVFSRDSGRSCCVNLTTCPGESVLVDVDKATRDSQLLAAILDEPCQCHGDQRTGGHLRCDYTLVVNEPSDAVVLFIEIKTGYSNQQRDVEHGFRQVICSGNAFGSTLDQCVVVLNHVRSFGVVVSPAFALSLENDRRRITWGVEHGIRLIHVMSSEDIWEACAAD